MYCSKCGRPLPPSGICSCQSQEPDQPTAPPTGSAPHPYSSSPLRRVPSPYADALDRFYRSPLVLALMVCYGLSILLSLGQSTDSTSTLLSALLSAVPSVLIFLGMILLFRGGSRSLSGLNLANVALIIRLVATLLGLVLVLILSVVGLFFFASLFDSELSSDFTVVIVIYGVVVLLIGGLSVLYLVRVRQTVLSSRAILAGQATRLKVSRYPIVILGINTLLSLSCLVTLQVYGTSLARWIRQLAWGLSYSAGTDLSERADAVVAALGLESAPLLLVSRLLSTAVTALFLVVMVQYRGISQRISD